jgi:hypothetical protein
LDEMNIEVLERKELRDRSFLVREGQRAIVVVPTTGCGSFRSIAASLLHPEGDEVDLVGVDIENVVGVNA